MLRGAKEEEWLSDCPLLGHTYRRYRDVLHVRATLDPHGAAHEKAPPELRAVSLLLRCAPRWSTAQRFCLSSPRRLEQS